MKEENLIRDTEIYILAQFIDVLENIENFECLEEIKNDIRNRKQLYKQEIKKMLEEDFFDIDEIDKSIDEKIEKYSRIYTKNEKYKKIEQKIEEIKKKIKKEQKEKVEEIEELIYEKCNYDFKSAYRLGMIEGIKMVTLKN